MTQKNLIKRNAPKLPIEYPKSVRVQSGGLVDNTYPDPDELPQLFRETVQDLYNIVLKPVLENLVDRLRRAESCESENSDSDESRERLQIIYLEACKAFWLTLASQHERHLREYLTSFANKLDRTDLLTVTNSSKRDDVIRQLNAITDMHLEPKKSKLREFMLVANVCRHGPGNSLMQLYEKHHQDWWPQCLWPIPGSKMAPADHSMPFLYNLAIDRGRLDEFVDALMQFWRQLEQTRGLRYSPPIVESPSHTNLGRHPS